MTKPYDCWLSIAQVEALHEQALAEHGGEPGVLDHGCVERSLAGAWTAQMYRKESPDQPDDLFSFAAYAFRYLARNHCYADGNKRVAWLALISVLQRSGLTLNASIDQAESFVNSASSNSYPDHHIEAWISEHLTALDPADR